MTQKFLGVKGLAGELDVSRHAVDKWLDRYPPGSDHPFPTADADTDGVLGWAPERLDEIRKWRAGMVGRGAGGGRPPRQPMES